MRCPAISRMAVLAAASLAAGAATALAGEAAPLSHPLTVEVPGWAILRLAPPADSGPVPAPGGALLSIGVPLYSDRRFDLGADGQIEAAGEGLRGILWLKVRF